MKEILITSSVLIVALLILRLIFFKTVSRRVQYALWALVLVRLFLPVNLPAIAVSVLNAGQAVQSAVSRSMERELYVLPIDRAPATNYPAADQVQPGQTVPSGESADYPVLSGDGRTVVQYAQRRTVGEVLTALWLAGAAVMACFFMATNLRFWWRLRKTRIPYAVEGCRYPVFLCTSLPSPCLFGLLRPVIYLTGAATASQQGLRHVLAHEETHARHLDPLWSLLRCVCLAVYWFDPLVWLAAWVSKADCELACDEGTLLRLGDDQRLSYGKTLLSLIPVRRGPSNPMLSATTMTAGKRQLKERITRISNKHMTAAAALIIAVTLVLAVSACTFTGGSGAASRPLTGAELAFFNGEFFNGGDVIAGDMNFRNQFLSSLYAAPEDINLFDLFYCEGTASSEEENLLVYGQGELDFPTYKLTATQMDALLYEYTGLTLNETNRVGLDGFTYLADAGAYYWGHGDTNYRLAVSFTAGEREGDTIRLYYEDLFLGGGWKCLTLADQGEGAYHFSSNQLAEKPAIATVFPEGKPEHTISLDDLAPYEAPAVTVERHRNDCAEQLEAWNTGEHTICIYRSTDGNTYAAVSYAAVSYAAVAEWEAGCFLTLPDGEYGIDLFTGLFGYDGIRISYYGQIGQNEYGTIYDYYYITSDAVPMLLARAASWEESLILDLDGDGRNELVSGRQIFFQRAGKVYQAHIPTLLSEVSQQPIYWDYSTWDANAKCLTVTGLADSQAGEARTFWRYLYFDGTNLLVYQDTRTYQDHVMEDIRAPEAVLAAAKDYVLNQLQDNGDGTFSDKQWIDAPAIYDDWRIERLSGPYRYKVEGITVDAYRFNYELHTTTPEHVVLAGGRYLSEDDWSSPGYPNCDFLFFQVMNNSGPTYLWHDMINDTAPGSESFLSSMKQRLKDLGLIYNTPKSRVQAGLEEIMASGYVTMDLSTAIGGGRYAIPPDQGNGPNRAQSFTSAFRWSLVEGTPAPPQGADTLTVALDDVLAFQFWAGSSLVRFTDREEIFWFLAERINPDDVLSNDIFDFMRFWYDEAEWASLTASLVIPDSGQGQQAVAQAWVAAYEGAMLGATPGGKYTCTYVKSTAGVEPDMPESWFPDEILDYEHFAFSYHTVFIPENTAALRWMMAGNTAEAEEGMGPDGSYVYSRIGSMYLTGDGWRCHSIGTG